MRPQRCPSVSRVIRVAALLHRELAMLLQLNCREALLRWVTVSHVEVSPDFSHATVQVLFMPQQSQEEIASGLRQLAQMAPFFQAKLGRTLSLRRTPKLRFEQDQHIRHAASLSSFIDQVRAQDRAEFMVIR